MLIRSYDLSIINYGSERWISAFEYRNSEFRPAARRNKQITLPTYVVDEIERQPNQVEFLTSLISEFIEKREKIAAEQSITTGSAS